MGFNTEGSAIDPDDYLPDFDGAVDRILPTVTEASLAASRFIHSLYQLPRQQIGDAM